jgi:hypothetical protein
MQLQECSILWKMENHCINGWSKRMNIVYSNIFHGCEWFSGLEFLVIELVFWQLQSWLLANHLLVFSIAYGLVQFMSQLENARDSHFRIKPRFLQQKQDLLLLHYSMVSWNYVEEPEKDRVLNTCSCNCSWQILHDKINLIKFFLNYEKSCFWHHPMQLKLSFTMSSTYELVAKNIL